MSHSTHVGFSEPPICSLSGRELRACVAWLALPLRQSRAVGVATRRLWFTARPSSLPLGPLLRPSGLKPCGVGHKPEPIPLMRRPNVGSSQHCPPAVIPERGQVTEDSPKSSSKEGWAVLHEDVAGSNFANDPRHVSPQAAAGAVDASPPPGNADVLARKSSRHHINNASPRMSVKGANVIPNRERRELSIVLSSQQYAGGVVVSLNGADRAPAEQVAAEDASTSAREKSQLIHAARLDATTN